MSGFRVNYCDFSTDWNVNDCEVTIPREYVVLTILRMESVLLYCSYYIWYIPVQRYNQFKLQFEVVHHQAQFIHTTNTQ